MTDASRQTPPPRPTPKSASRKPTKALTTRARDAANDAGDKFVEGVEANPLATLAAGIVVGLVAGALLPKSKLEGRYLGPLGAALNDSAVLAAKAAREAGTAELAAIGVSKVGANEQVSRLLEGLGGALRTASEAARESRKKSPARPVKSRAKA